MKRPNGIIIPLLFLTMLSTEAFEFQRDNINLGPSLERDLLGSGTIRIDNPLETYRDLGSGVGTGIGPVLGDNPIVVGPRIGGINGGGTVVPPRFDERSGDLGDPASSRSIRLIPTKIKIPQKISETERELLITNFDLVEEMLNDSLKNIFELKIDWDETIDDVLTQLHITRSTNENLMQTENLSKFIGDKNFNSLETYISKIDETMNNLYDQMLQQEESLHLRDGTIFKEFNQEVFNLLSEEENVINELLKMIEKAK